MECSCLALEAQPDISFLQQNPLMPIKREIGNRGQTILVALSNMTSESLTEIGLNAGFSLLNPFIPAIKTLLFLRAIK